MPEEFGLPTQQLFVLVSERAAMVSNVGNVLSELDTVQQAEIDASDPTRVTARKPRSAAVCAPGSSVREDSRRLSGG